MHEIKYVIVDKMGCDVPILTQDPISHAEASGQYKADSAGFVKFTKELDKIIVSCYGKSISLNLKAQEDRDEVLIANMMNTLSFDEEKLFVPYCALCKQG